MSRWSGAIAAETTKITTTRLWWILALVLVGYVGLLAGGLAALFSALPEGAGFDPQTTLPPLVYSLASSIGYVFPVLFGALVTTSEFKNQTLTPTFLAQPRRAVVLGAKVVVMAVAGAVYGVIGLAASIGVGAVVLTALGLPTGLDESSVWAVIGRVVLAMALWAVIGLALGVLVPSPVAAIVIVLAFTQFVEPLLRTASSLWEWTAEVGAYLPGAASDALVGSSVFSLTMGSGADLLWWQGGLVLTAYALVFAVLGAATTWRRDVT